MRTTSLLLSVLCLTACVAESDEIFDSNEGQALAEGEYSLFNASSRPVVESDSDTGAVELGVRFKSDVAGQIVGLRFYKGSGNGGVHVGHVWSANGQLLGSKTFTKETATGWQTVRFGTPVAIAAGALYVASYHAPRGRYSADNGFFTGRDVDNGPLHAARDSSSSHNGVYRYGEPGFPTSSWAGSNYWVDVIFKPSGTSTSPTTDAGTLPVADAGTPPATDAGTTTTDSGAAPSSVAHGKDINATNTGVPAGTTLTPMSGVVTLSTPGQVWEGKDLTGNVVVTADNVTIRNCKIRSSDYFAVKITGKNALVERCEIFSPGGAYTGLLGAGATFRRNNLYKFENAIVATDSNVIEENYIHDLYYGPGAHVDGVEWGSSGSNSIVRRNRIHLGGDTGCVNVTPWGGGSATNNTVEDNFFSGGTYSLYIRGDGGGTVNGVKVTGNVWARTHVYGPMSIVAASNITWSNNKYEDGAVINY